MAVQGNAVTSTNSTSSTNVQLTHQASGNDRFVVVFATTRGSYAPGTNVAQVTYGGDLMTLAGHISATGAAATNDIDMDVFTLVNPPTSAETVEAQAVQAHAWTIFAVSYTGVDQDSPYSIITSTNAGGTDINLTITSSSDEKIVFGGMTAGAGYAPVAYPDIDWSATVIHNDGNDGLDNASITGHEAGSNSVTIGFTLGVGKSLGLIALSLKPRIAGRSRAIKYYYDIYSDILLDDLGVAVDPWEIQPDNWIKVTGFLAPRSDVYSSLTKDPTVGYIEEVYIDKSGRVQIKTDASQFLETQLANAINKRTI